MKPADLLQLLREFYRDKATLRQRHVVGARSIGNYDFNNTYQYVINREDLHLSWLRDAISDFGGKADEVPEPELRLSGNAAEVQRTILNEDTAAAQGFVDRWRDRVETVTNARNRIMLRVILGETLEHKRFFEQAAAGRDDLLGRRADGAGTPGVVLGTRWVE